MGLAADIGGEGAPLLVLLHGLGATREVWRGLTDQAASRWPGRWVAFDLPGHGRSPAAEDYAPQRQAGAVAGAILSLAPATPLLLLGHSMGGVVALALASGRYGVRPARALAIGIKAAWSPEDIAGMTARSAAPARMFPTREAAVERYLKVSGLAGLVDPTSETALAGVSRTDDGGWRLAMDAAANGVGAPDMARLLGEAICPVSLACGETDPMTSTRELSRWGPQARELAGLGHNAMVESPDAIWSWLTGELASAHATA